MVTHQEMSNKELTERIRNKNILVGGNVKLKIYGILGCKSGKRLKKENRVFFRSVCEAQELGYRPCGHCMRPEYKNWKNGSF